MGGPLNGGADTANGGIIIPTTIQVSSDLLSYWVDMTCLYDPNWVAEQDRATLPIAFFHITSIREMGTTNVSKKRVILYEPQTKESYTAANLASKFRPSVLRSIADSAVREAKTYEVEAVVPFQPIGRYVTDGVTIITSTISSFLSLLGLYDESQNSQFTSMLATVTEWADNISRIATMVGKLPSMNGVSYINKNSLEAMWDTTHFLCMKMWTGYDYKYVLITNIVFDKKPLEDDVYRCTMQLMEVPVLTVTKPKNLKLNTQDWNAAAKIISFTEKALSAPLVALMGVGNASK